MPGTLYGVGLGPGDPELVTVKAARIIAAADVIAYHSARHGRSIARTIAEPYLREGQIEEQLVYPVTTETTDHPGGYAGVMEEFYAAAAERLAAHLDDGRDVALLAEGDPLFFSSYMHLHKRLAARFDPVIVPAVTSISAATAATKTPLVEGDEILTVLPGTLPRDVLADRLRHTQAAAIMKLGRGFSTVRAALADSGRLAAAHYVERASRETERVLPVADVDPESVPYMSLVLVPGPLASSGAATPANEPGHTNGHRRGSVAVIGLGPGQADWLTPQAQAELAAAEHIVGYKTYVDRVPANPRQRRHASDNKVETERAAFALDLARGGSRVAVVSSGDPGIFAMGSAVLEVADRDGYHDVDVRIVPGLTAAQAVASRIGAPLGHDFCVLSLSDRLKPWAVIARRLDAVAAADLVVAIYNPASRSGRNRVGDARELLLCHRNPDTPVVIGRAIGSADESVRVVTLADLRPGEVDMQTLLIIGSSQTRVTGTKELPRVYTPRTHPGLVSESAATS
jgi:precorrin-2 C20-methyltransferase/precorrin-3B C17-methyltransferase